MAAQILNEAEQFLLKSWSEARMLEESMDNVRAKYKEIFQRIVEAVSEAHSELDANAVYVTQFWDSGSIGFGRRSWPVENPSWPPGFWIDQLRLENLSAEDAVPPSATIWIPIKSAKKIGIDLTEARKKVILAAQEILSEDEFDRCGKSDANKEIMLSFPMPARRELIDMFAVGDGQRFVACFVSQLDLLARFVPVLDKLLIH